MHARARPRNACAAGVQIWRFAGSKRLTLVPLGACARRCRLRSHCAPSTQASVVASASSAASGRPETAISVSLLARSHALPSALLSTSGRYSSFYRVWVLPSAHKHNTTTKHTRATKLGEQAGACGSSRWARADAKARAAQGRPRCCAVKRFRSSGTLAEPG